MKDFWNQRYSRSDFVYGTEPNQFFKQELEKLQPGQLILPADGEGRNAVYAADLGWKVTAVDYSEKARDKALKLAAKSGVSIDYHLSDLADFDFSSGVYDAAAFIYVHLPRSIIHQVYEKVIAACKPGAQIIAEVYSVNQLGRDSGGPTDERVLYTIEKMESLLKGTSIQMLKETEILLNEGPFHVGKAMVIRAMATVL